MAFDAFPTYLRSQVPSGMVPQQGAAQGAGARATAEMGLAQSVAGIGRSISDIGADMESEQLRQSSINQVLALTDIDRQHRTFLSDMKQRPWTENGVGTWDKAVSEWNKAFKGIVSGHLKRLHPKQRAAWEADMERRNLYWSDAVVAQAAELREDYANEAITARYVNLYAAGDVAGAKELAQMGGKLFEDDALWQKRLAEANEQIVWKIAQRGNMTLAESLIHELLPIDRRTTVGSAIDRYKNFMDEKRYSIGAEMSLQDLSKSDALVVEGKTMEALATVQASQWLDQSDKDREAARLLKTGKEAVTTPEAFLDTMQAQLLASTGQLDPKTQMPLATPAQAREIAAVHRYDNGDLSADDFSFILKIPDDVSIRTMLSDLLIRHRARIGPNPAQQQTAAQAARAVVLDVIKAQAEGKEISVRDLDLRAREYGATQSTLSAEQMQQMADNAVTACESQSIGEHQVCMRVSEIMLDAGTRKKPKDIASQYGFDIEAHEPETLESFTARVKNLGDIDLELARAYYDRWKGKWQNP
jgi:hypothetical protein